MTRTSLEAEVYRLKQKQAALIIDNVHHIAENNRLRKEIRELKRNPFVRLSHAIKNLFKK